MKKEWDPPFGDEERAGIQPGEYITFVNDLNNPDKIIFNPDRFEPQPESRSFNMYDWFLGFHYRGQYHLPNDSSRTVFSFLYHKIEPSGVLEDKERLIVSAGFGYGEHSNHQGQPPSWYIVGYQIGVIGLRGEVEVTESMGSKIPLKHFSLACVVDGPYGEPILANPSTNEK